MPSTHGKLRLRQREITRVVKALEAAGRKTTGVEVGRDGTYKVLVGEPGTQGNGGAIEDAGVIERRLG